MKMKLQTGKNWRDSHRAEFGLCSCKKGYATETVAHPDFGIGLGGQIETATVCERCAKRIMDSLNEELARYDREDAQRHEFNPTIFVTDDES